MINLCHTRPSYLPFHDYLPVHHSSAHEMNRLKSPKSGGGSYWKLSKNRQKPIIFAFVRGFSGVVTRAQRDSSRFVTLVHTHTNVVMTLFWCERVAKLFETIMSSVSFRWVRAITRLCLNISCASFSSVTIM